MAQEKTPHGTGGAFTWHRWSLHMEGHEMGFSLSCPSKTVLQRFFANVHMAVVVSCSPGYKMAMQTMLTWLGLESRLWQRW